MVFIKTAWNVFKYAFAVSAGVAGAGAAVSYGTKAGVRAVKKVWNAAKTEKKSLTDELGEEDAC